MLQLLRAYFEIAEQDSDRTARERIAGKLLLLDESFADDLPLIFDFLAVPDPERPAIPDGPGGAPAPAPGSDEAPQPRRERSRAGRRPCSRTCTGSTRRARLFLANHVEAVQGTRSLTVLNFRPEYHAAWMSRSYYRQIALAPLGPEAIEADARATCSAPTPRSTGWPS